jgi:hypothetical protein
MSALKSNELRALIDKPHRREKKCGEYIPLIWDKLLLGYRSIKLIETIPEYRGHLGDCDYVIIAMLSDGSRECTKAFFWELKAPQCNIFDVDPSNENRLRPSQDLIDAENQLLYYYHEHKHAPEFIKRHNLGGSINVHLGGIIIGSNNRKIKGKTKREDKEGLYDEALDVRHLIYDALSMRFMTWDEIYNILRAQEAPPIEVPPEIFIEEVTPSITKTSGKMIISIEEPKKESL